MADRWLRRIAAAVVTVLALALAAVVILGIATGHSTHFEKGETSPWLVGAQVALGLVTLAVLAVALTRLGRRCRGADAEVAAWFVGGALTWVLWAFVRLIQTSS
jgi:chromate transport protein ChrA